MTSLVSISSATSCRSRALAPPLVIEPPHIARLHSESHDSDGITLFFGTINDFCNTIGTLLPKPMRRHVRTWRKLTLQPQTGMDAAGRLHLRHVREGHPEQRTASLSHRISPSFVLP
jgi:hypothetical protein